MSKRLKTVFPSHANLCHAFMSQNLPRGKDGSMYFEGNTLFSYGPHFPLATIHKDVKVIYNNTRKASMTTSSKHQPAFRNAINSTYKVFSSDLDSTCSHEEMSAALEKKVYDAFEKLFTSRNTHTFYISDVVNTVKDFNDHADIFKLKVKRIKLDDYMMFLLEEYLVKRNLDGERLNNQLEKRRANKRMENERLWEERRLAREKEEKEFSAKMEENKAAWLSGESVNFSTLSGQLTLLRVKDETVETSLGANVPLDHAVRLLKKIIAKEVKEGDRVGLYNFEQSYESDDGDTILKIGCHRIALSEAMRVLGHLI